MTHTRSNSWLTFILAIGILTLANGAALAGVSTRSHHHSSSHHSSSGHHPSSYRSHGVSHSRNYYRRCAVTHGNGGFASNGFSFSVGMPFMNADISQHYHQDQPDVLVNGVWMTDPNAAPLDAKLSLRKMSTCTFSFSAGFSQPLKKIGENSMLAIEGLVGMELYHWNVGTVNYSENTSAFDSAYSQNFNLPLSINYVIGGEANGHSRTTFTIGAGEAITITSSKYINSATRVSTRPFVMAELGVLEGVPLKLRATAYLNRITLIDKPNGSLYDAMEADGNIDGNIGVKMTGTGGVNLSLVMMPGFHKKW